eukprot:10209999-Lingulodinium_polyedra.AAC.1
MTRSNRNFAGTTARKPHARAFHAHASFGARTKRANVRFASRCAHGTSIQPRHRADSRNDAQ